MTQTAEPWFRTPEPTPCLAARRRNVREADRVQWGTQLETVCNSVQILNWSFHPILFQPNIILSDMISAPFHPLLPSLKVTEKWRLPRGKIKQRFVIIIIDISPRAERIQQFPENWCSKIHRDDCGGHNLPRSCPKVTHLCVTHAMKHLLDSNQEKSWPKVA